MIYIERVVNNKVIYGWGKKYFKGVMVDWRIGPFSKDKK